MSDKSNTAVQVVNLSKSFNLPHEKTTSIKSAIIGLRKNKGYEKQQVLNNISFEIKKGEFFGIVGRNGSGKSTLLKLLAGIYSPDKGSIKINGKLTPFIELGVGFNPELTGRENVYLNGALLGYSRQEMSEMYDEIVEFAELGRFMDQKLKNYSSGMQVRLAFSIAIKSKSEILLFDEVLAVGDERFQKKCLEVFRKLKEEKRTIILVTHDMSNVERFCDRAMVVGPNHDVVVTSPSEASVIYAELNIDQEKVNINNKNHDKLALRHGTHRGMVGNVTTTLQGKKSSVFKVGKSLTLKIDIDSGSITDVDKIVCGLAIFNTDNVTVAGPNSLKTSIKTNDLESICFTVPDINFAPGEYTVTIVIYDNNMTIMDYLDKWVSFNVISDHTIAGIVDLEGEWIVNKKRIN